jgi:hypothetical protein
MAEPNVPGSSRRALLAGVGAACAAALAGCARYDTSKAGVAGGAPALPASKPRPQPPSRPDRPARHFGIIRTFREKPHAFILATLVLILIV